MIHNGYQFAHIIVPYGTEWKLIAHQLRKTASDGFLYREISGKIAFFYGTLEMALVVKTIDRSKTHAMQCTHAYNTNGKNDIIEFHLRPDECQFPYTLEMLL